MFDKTEPIEEKLNDDEHNWRKDNHTNRFEFQCYKINTIFFYDI